MFQARAGRKIQFKLGKKLGSPKALFFKFEIKKIKYRQVWGKYA